MATIKAFTRFRAHRAQLALGLLPDLEKAIVQVKAHTRNGKPVAAHQREVLTSGEKGDMVSAMASKLAGGGEHVVPAGSPAHHAHHAAEAYAEQTGKSVHMYRHDDGSLRLSHAKPKGRPSLEVHADKTVAHHENGGSEELVHGNARVALKRVARKEAKAGKKGDVKKKTPAEQAHAEDGPTFEQAKAAKEQQAAGGDELHGKILDHLKDNPKTSLAKLREAMGHPKVDKNKPLENPVHAALKTLRDGGKVDVHGAGGFGEPSFSARAELGAPANDDHAAMRAHVEKKTGKPVHPDVDEALASATKAGNAHAAIERTYKLGGEARRDGDNDKAEAFVHAREAMTNSQAFKDQDKAHEPHREAEKKGEDMTAGAKPHLDGMKEIGTDMQRRGEDGIVAGARLAGRLEKMDDGQVQDVMDHATANKHGELYAAARDHLDKRKAAAESPEDKAAREAKDRETVARDDAALRAGHQKEAKQDAADHEKRQAAKKAGGKDLSKLSDEDLAAHAKKHEQGAVRQAQKAGDEADEKRKAHRDEAQRAREEQAKRRRGESKAPPPPEATMQGYAKSAKKAIPGVHDGLAKHVGARVEREVASRGSAAGVVKDLEALAAHHDAKARDPRAGGGWMDPKVTTLAENMRRTGLKWDDSDAIKAEDARGLANHVRALADRHGWKVDPPAGVR